MFDHPPSKEGRGLEGGGAVMLKCSVLYFTFCPLPLILPLCTTEKSVAQSSLPPPTIPIRCLYMLKRSLLSYLFWRLKKTSFPNLSSYVRCSNLLIIFVAVWWTCSSLSMSFLYWGAPKWTQYSKCGCTSGWWREVSPSLTCWPCFP